MLIKSFMASGFWRPSTPGWPRRNRAEVQDVGVFHDLLAVKELDGEHVRQAAPRQEAGDYLRIGLAHKRDALDRGVLRLIALGPLVPDFARAANRPILEQPHGQVVALALCHGGQAAQRQQSCQEQCQQFFHVSFPPSFWVWYTSRVFLTCCAHYILHPRRAVLSQVTVLMRRPAGARAGRGGIRPPLSSWDRNPGCFPPPIAAPRAVGKKARQSWEVVHALVQSASYASEARGGMAIEKQHLKPPDLF